jgi:hypothetical protein
MKKASFVTLLAVTVFLALLGCIPSVYPLYTEKDLTYDPALLGSWREKEDSEGSWTFTQDKEKTYKLVIRDKDKSSPFLGRLLKLGDRRFLDITPDGAGLEDLNREDLYKALLIPGHFFFRVDQVEPALKLTALKGDWLNNLLKKDPKAIQHLQHGSDTVILTAPTEELQKFILKHLKDEDAWGDSSDFKKFPSGTVK